MDAAGTYMGKATRAIRGRWRCYVHSARYEEEILSPRPDERGLRPFVGGWVCCRRNPTDIGWYSGRSDASAANALREKESVGEVNVADIVPSIALRQP